MSNSSAERLIRSPDVDVEALLAAVTDESGVSEERITWLATVASAKITFDGLCTAIDRRATFPATCRFLAHWLHAALLRTDSAPLEPVLREFHDELRAAGDPLGWLPLLRMPLERRELLPAYLPCGARIFVPERRALAAAEMPADLRIIPLHNASELPRLRTLADWDWDPSGRVAMHSVRPPPAALSAALLARLGLRSAALATALAPEETFAALYMLGATNGLEEGRGIQPLASLGRLLAWRGLAALTGLPTNASCEEIERATRACAWAGARDLFMLVALRPDGTIASVEIARA